MEQPSACKSLRSTCSHQAEDNAGSWALRLGLTPLKFGGCHRVSMWQHRKNHERGGHRSISHDDNGANGRGASSPFSWEPPTPGSSTAGKLFFFVENKLRAAAYEGARIGGGVDRMTIFQKQGEEPSDALHKHTRAHRRAAAACGVGTCWLSPGLSAVIGARIHLSAGVLGCLFRPWRWSPCPGILKKTCLVPSSGHCPHCAPLPSLVKVKTKPAQTLHC